MKYHTIEMSKKQVYIGIAVMLLLCTMIYSNHFHNDFHFDDSHSIQNNPAIRDIHNIPLFFKDGSTISILPQNQAYRPLAVTSIAFDYWLGHGYNLFYFHLSTFILFLLQGVLMVFFYNSIFNKGTGATKKLAMATALVTATWYLLHPAIAETVNYIVARADLQSTLFLILAFVLYINSPFCRKTFLYLIPVIVGAFAKPPVVLFAPLLFIYILFFEYGLSVADAFKPAQVTMVWKAFKKCLPALICCVALYVFLGKMTPKTWEPGGSSPLKYLVTQPFVIFHYFQMLFVPTALSADTDWGLLPRIWDIRFFIGCAFILIMLGIIFYTSKTPRQRPISFGLLWFFITLAPTSSIIPLGEVLNDHRMFLPFVGLAMSVTWTIALIIDKYAAIIAAQAQYRVIGFIALFVTLSLYAYGTHERNNVWHTEESLWYDVTIKSPQNGRGLMNYGLTQMAKGDYKTTRVYFERAALLLPAYYTLDINLAVLNAAEGNDTAAEQYFLKAIKDGNNFPDAHFYYARFLLSKGRYNEALGECVKTVQISPHYLEARLLLMNIYEATENWSELKLMAESTLAIAPNDARVKQYLIAAQYRKSRLDIEADEAKAAPTAQKYLTLSAAYYQAGKFEQCIAAAEEAIKVDPKMAEAYNNIGSAYNSLKQYEKAVPPLKTAVELAPDFQLAKNNLMVAQSGLSTAAAAATTAEDYLNQSLADFNSGKYQDCIDACYKALKLRPGYDLAYNNICAAYNKLGQYEKAIRAGEEGVKWNPKNQLLKNNLRVSYYHVNKSR